MTKVSVSMITFNHEEFIREAIESVLVQRTNFKYELVIGDDCSTDNTRNIIMEYKKKYPDIIKLNLQEKNIGSRKNSISNLSMCEGKYIALLEGDDYWIDENKLQKQVDFLDSNPDCTFCGHSYRQYYQETENFFGDVICKEYKFTLEDLLKEDASNNPNKLYIRLLTMIFRKSVIDNPPDIWYKVPYGDYLLEILCLQKGYGACLEEIMGVYRINKNSMTQKNMMSFLEHSINVRKQILEYLPKEYHGDLQKSIKNRILKKEYFEFIREFKENINDRKIIDYFEKNKFNKIAIYGAGSLGNLLADKLKQSDIKVLFFIDKKITSYREKNIIKPKQIDERLSIDAVIITPFYDFDNIKEELLEVGMHCKIISLKESLE